MHSSMAGVITWHDGLWVCTCEQLKWWSEWSESGFQMRNGLWSEVWHVQITLKCVFMVNSGHSQVIERESNWNRNKMRSIFFQLSTSFPHSDGNTGWVEYTLPLSSISSVFIGHSLWVSLMRGGGWGVEGKGCTEGRVEVCLLGLEERV